MTIALHNCGGHHSHRWPCAWWPPPLELCSLVALVTAPSPMFSWYLRSVLQQFSHLASHAIWKSYFPHYIMNSWRREKVLSLSVSRVRPMQRDCGMVIYPACCCFMELEPLPHGFCQPSSSSPTFPSLCAHPVSFLPVPDEASPSQIASLAIIVKAIHKVFIRH